MNIPMSWLQNYVEIDCDIHEFVEAMTMSGTKVEAVEQMGKEITNVVVGKILKIEKHPDADKLVVAQIDIAADEPVQIITGATNVFEGAIIPVALHGATLANGLNIKKGKIRGVLSNGMMCSVEELGFTRHDYPESPENGIYIFQDDVKIGSNPLEVLEMLDDVVEYEITSNRSDCFSVLGVAREAAATFGKEFKFPTIEVKENAGGNAADFISVEIQNSELCPRYMARVVKNVKIEPSPQWLRHRLTASGIRPINNIVDITNYVMLEFGQPMHAFDIDEIEDRHIIVRNAKDNEEFTTLDGTKRILDSSMLVISDPKKAVAIAGIMGGENSKVSEHASAILFESANFNGSNIRVSSKKLGLRTDSSSKYEKNLDPNLAEQAVNRAVQLVELLQCGEVVSGTVDCYPNKRESREVVYSPEKINRLLGTNISKEDMETYLARLEIKAVGNKAVIPTFRSDIGIEVDIAEEVARLYGYNRIETTLASGMATVGKKKYSQIIEDTIKNTCVALGLSEALLYSFESPKVFEKLNLNETEELAKSVVISNPLGEDFSVMRSTPLNGILQSLSTNYNRRNEEAALFEMGKVYIPKQVPLTELPEEAKMLTIGLYGKKDFFDIKGMLEQILATLGIQASFTAKTDSPFLHPGRAASIQCNQTEIGYLGEVHPSVAERYSIGTKVYVAVLNLSELIDRSNMERNYKQLPKYPASVRDIAMLVKDDVFVADIETIITESAGKILESVSLFDVYKGKQIQEGHKSVAYTLTFRAEDRTLTEEEIVKSMSKVVRRLEEKIGAQLRDK